MLDYKRGYQAIAFQSLQVVINVINMSLYDGVDIDGVPMQSNSAEGTDITKLCELIYNFFTFLCISVMSSEVNFSIS